MAKRHPSKPKKRLQDEPLPLTLQPDDSREVRVLSVHQPWSDGIVHGWKVVENRTWETPFRGRIYIHASKLEPRPDHTAIEKRHGSKAMADEVCGLWNLPGSRVVGAIVGSVELVDIVPMDLPEFIESVANNGKRTLAKALPELLEEFPDISMDRIERIWKLMSHLTDEKLWALWQGPFCWILERPRILAKPIPTPGKLNLWKFMLPASVDD